MSRIHPTALIDPAAELADDVAIGPYTTIGPNVRIGAGTTVGAHCVVEGRTTIGRDNRIFQFCSLGAAPQDKKYADEPTGLSIGDGNTIREFCTFNLGTAQDAGVTRVGDGNWVMAYVHVAHDCQVGSHTILANATQLGGHVHVGDWAVVGGLTGVHQFTRIGAHAMTGFSTRLAQDLPPFMVAAGNPAEAQGVNQEGLRRRGFSGARIAAIKQAHRLLYRRGLTLEQAQAEIAALREAQSEAEPEAAADIDQVLDFLRIAKRGIVR